MSTMEFFCRRNEDDKLDNHNASDISYKRIIDVIVSVAAIAFLIPVIFIIVIFIYLQDGRPLIYRHERVGRNGTTFSCLKFRTMRRDADEVLCKLLNSDEAARQEWRARQKLSKDPRIHWLGRFLRMTSLDEVPQFVNVLRGEMSIVGPRPIVEEEVARYGDRINYYYSMTPGLTGLWQISGRNDTSYQARVDLDTEYYHRRSLRLDLKIMWKTIGVLLFDRNGC